MLLVVHGVICQERRTCDSCQREVEHWVQRPLTTWFVKEVARRQSCLCRNISRAKIPMHVTGKLSDGIHNSQPDKCISGGACPKGEFLLQTAATHHRIQHFA